MALPHAKQVDFEGIRGPVADRRSDAILKQLEGSGGDSDLLQKHLAYEQAVNAGSPLVLGNKLTLLQNGPDTYAAMFAAIRAARDHINLETYIFADDVVGEQFAALLLERQAAGVQVNVIHDSVGSLGTPDTFTERMRAGGIQVLEFNPANPLDASDKAWAPNHRDHRKLLVIDGRIAFVGGINISDDYSRGPSGGRLPVRKEAHPESGTGWRDTHMQIEGPVVAEFQKLFIETWTNQRAPALAPRGYFPVAEVRGDEIVRAIGSTPDHGQSLMYLTLISAISRAERRMDITIAYFAPDPQLLAALTAAARRGVRVRLVLPDNSDSWMALHLGRSYYGQLLRVGIGIYQRRGAVMHAKTASIDGVWSTIGSTNLDWRSFLYNDEVNAVVLGRGFALQMDAMFEQDIAESVAITPAEWRRRPLRQRLQERLARIGGWMI